MRLSTTLLGLAVAVMAAPAPIAGRAELESRYIIVTDVDYEAHFKNAGSKTEDKRSDTDLTPALFVRETTNRDETQDKRRDVVELGNGTFDGTIAGGGTLSKEGTGVLTLTGGNAYTGVTELGSGTLQLSDAGALPFSNGALQLDNRGLLLDD